MKACTANTEPTCSKMITIVLFHYDPTVCIHFSDSLQKSPCYNFLNLIDVRDNAVY